MTGHSLISLTLLTELDKYVKSVLQKNVNVIMLGDSNLTLDRQLDVIAGHNHDVGHVKLFNLT